MALIQKATGGIGIIVLLLFVVFSFKLYTISSNYEYTIRSCRVMDWH